MRCVLLRQGCPSRGRAPRLSNWFITRVAGLKCQRQRERNVASRLRGIGRRVFGARGRRGLCGGPGQGGHNGERHGAAARAACRGRAVRPGRPGNRDITRSGGTAPPVIIFLRTVGRDRTESVLEQRGGWGGGGGRWGKKKKKGGGGELPYPDGSATLRGAASVARRDRRARLTAVGQGGSTAPGAPPRRSARSPAALAGVCDPDSPIAGSCPGDVACGSLGDEQRVGSTARQAARCGRHPQDRQPCSALPPLRPRPGPDPALRGVNGARPRGRSASPVGREVAFLADVSTPPPQPIVAASR